MSWPTRDDYILRGARVPYGNPGGVDRADGPRVRCEACIDCDLCLDDPDEHVYEDCHHYSMCCGAALNSDIEGFCPKCGEHC